jgi:hypothetical protein
MSYGGYVEEALGGRPRVFKKKAAKPRPSSRGRISYGGFEFAGIQDYEHFGARKIKAPYQQTDNK